MSPKSLLISGAKNEPSGHGEVLLLKWQKDQQMWKHFPYTLPNFEGCKGATFQGRKQNLYSFLFILPKVTPLHPGFSLSIFRRKITEIDRAVIPSEVVRLESYPPQFFKFGHVPLHPSQTMIEKNKIMILCSICTLIFVSGGKGGCRAWLVPAQESKRWSFGRLLLRHSEGSIFGPEKVEKN